MTYINDKDQAGTHSRREVIEIDAVLASILADARLVLDLSVGEILSHATKSIEAWFDTKS